MKTSASASGPNIAGSSDFYIADNLFLGRDDRYRLVGWTGARWGDIGAYPSHRLVSYYGIKVYGPGHVIAHNAVAYFHDAICISTYGTPEPDPDRRASSIDIYDNDFHMLNDDFVETDGGVHNIRVYQNRGVNAFHGGYSSQPLFGGPVYFFRNLLYHVQSGMAFKLDARPAGLLSTTTRSLASRSSRSQRQRHWRNNLFLGRDTPDRGIMLWANATGSTVPTTTASAPTKASPINTPGWRPRNPGRPSTTTSPKTGSTSEPSPNSGATGQEKHGVELDFDIFEKMTPPDPAPQARHTVYHAMDLNFRLKPNTKAIDAGEILPTINDNYTGRAPDLGALELNQPEPQYGPRWITWKPFYR